MLGRGSGTVYQQISRLQHATLEGLLSEATCSTDFFSAKGHKRSGRCLATGLRMSEAQTIVTKYEAMSNTEVLRKMK